MNTPALTDHYKHHRFPGFPVEIVTHGVWLYFRFCLSYRSIRGEIRSSYAPPCLAIMLTGDKLTMPFRERQLVYRDTAAAGHYGDDRFPWA